MMYVSGVCLWRPGGTETMAIGADNLPDNLDHHSHILQLVAQTVLISASQRLPHPINDR